MKNKPTNNLVPRFVIEKANGMPFYASQGRYTFETVEDAVDCIEAIYANNDLEAVPTGLHVVGMDCYPGHYDPCLRSQEQPANGERRCILLRDKEGKHQASAVFISRKEAAELLAKSRRFCFVLRSSGGYRRYIRGEDESGLLILPGVYPQDPRLCETEEATPAPDSCESCGRRLIDVSRYEGDGRDRPLCNRCYRSLLASQAADDARSDG